MEKQVEKKHQEIEQLKSEKQKKKGELHEKEQELEKMRELQLALTRHYITTRGQMFLMSRQDLLHLLQAAISAVMWWLRSSPPMPSHDPKNTMLVVSRAANGINFFPQPSISNIDADQAGEKAPGQKLFNPNNENTGLRIS
jgi:uncharacterized protein (DUF3084 family)